jgi:hypothetical protein
MLKPISSGWQWLERTLNILIEEINAQKPLPSATIAVEEGPNGTLIKVAGTPKNEPPGSSGPSSSTPKPQPVVWHNVAWQQVTVVDPGSCAQSTIIVLVQSFGKNITIQ